MSWQPIESAPRDGTKILGWRDGECAVVYWATYVDGYGSTCVYWRMNEHNDPTGDEWKPDLWQPLPTPPSPPE